MNVGKAETDLDLAETLVREQDRQADRQTDMCNEHFCIDLGNWGGGALVFKNNNFRAGWVGNSSLFISKMEEQKSRATFHK